MKRLARRLLPKRLYSGGAVLHKRLKYALWSRTSEGERSRAELQRLKSLYSGRRCFVIGNGPSLNQTEVGRLKDEVCIGSNGIFLLTERTGFRPVIYTIEDKLVAEDRRTEAARYEVNTKIFPHDLGYCLSGVKKALFVYCNRGGDGRDPQFSEDITKVIHWGGTVTYFNLQIATFIGCNPIYLVGVDHSYQDKFAIAKEGTVWTSKEDDHNHFDPRYFGKGYRWHDPKVERMERAYVAARRFAENKRIDIINATVGGKLEVFPRVAFASLF